MPKYVYPRHMMYLSIIGSLCSTKTPLFLIVIFLVGSSACGSASGGREGPAGAEHWSMLFPIFSLSVKNILWFPGAQWDRKWPPTTALSAVSLELFPPHPTWGPSTSVRMVCPDPPRTSCPHPIHTHCPRSTAKFTIAPKGKVSGQLLPDVPLSLLLSLPWGEISICNYIYFFKKCKQY